MRSWIDSMKNPNNAVRRASLLNNSVRKNRHSSLSNQQFRKRSVEEVMVFSDLEQKRTQNQNIEKELGRADTTQFDVFNLAKES
jgi:hypothetical protein